MPQVYQGLVGAVERNRFMDQFQEGQQRGALQRVGESMASGDVGGALAQAYGSGNFQAASAIEQRIAQQDQSKAAARQSAADAQTARQEQYREAFTQMGPILHAASQEQDPQRRQEMLALGAMGVAQQYPDIANELMEGVQEIAVVGEQDPSSYGVMAQSAGFEAPDRDVRNVGDQLVEVGPDGSTRVVYQGEPDSANLQRVNAVNPETGNVEIHTFNPETGDLATTGVLAPPGSRQQIRVGPDGTVEIIEDTGRVPNGVDPNLPAAQRGRLAATITNLLDANNNLERMTTEGARFIAGPGDVGAEFLDQPDQSPLVQGLGRMMRSDESAELMQAASTWESAMMPFFAGQAQTEMEARRVIRSYLPQLGESNAQRERKARARRLLVAAAERLAVGESFNPRELLDEMIRLAPTNENADAPPSDLADAPPPGIENMSDEELQAIARGGQ